MSRAKWIVLSLVAIAVLSWLMRPLESVRIHELEAGTYVETTTHSRWTNLPVFKHWKVNYNPNLSDTEDPWLIIESWGPSDSENRQHGTWRSIYTREDRGGRRCTTHEFEHGKPLSKEVDIPCATQQPPPRSKSRQ